MGYAVFMLSHDFIDKRSLALAREIAARIDADPRHRALSEARARCRRWLRANPGSDLRLWAAILKQPWPLVRKALLDSSETGCRIRQSNPFCGVLSPRERWAVYRSFSHHDPATT
jgi:hypothetical protein